MTVGLVGFGRIGRAVARRLKGFSVRVLVNDPLAAELDGAEQVELDELLRRSDIVSLHAPLTQTTRNLIGTRELSLLRSEAILVNTSRGALVDETSLARALGDGRIRAAALDVFEAEPPAGSPLLGLPNVVLSPHIAGLSERSVITMVSQAVQNVLAVLDGSIGRERVVNPAVLGREHGDERG
jgi:phosphoglycerate dehydrogenase-like enzyme